MAFAGARLSAGVGFPASARLLSQPAATLILASYATAALLTGTALLRRCDIVS